MYWKHKIYIHFFGLMLMSANLYSWSFVDTLRGLFSFGLPENIFRVINKEIIGSLQAKNIRVFLPNKIEMDHVEAIDEFGDRVLYAKHIKLTISLISLLTNNIVISDAKVEAPFFHYTVKKNIHNVIRLFNDPPSQVYGPPTRSKLRVSVARIQLSNGSYEMEHDIGLKIFAEGIEGAGSFWAEQGPFGIDIDRASVSRGAIMVAGMDLPISNLLAQKLLISDQKISAQSLITWYEKARLSAHGTLFIDENRYDIKAKIDAPRNTYPQGLMKLPFIVPSFIANVAMAGTLENPEFEVDANLGATDFLGLSLIQGKILAHISSHQVSFSSSKLSVGDGGTIMADGLIDIDNQRFSVRSSEKNIRVEEFLKFVNLDIAGNGLINADTSLEGRLSLQNSPITITTKGYLGELRIEQISCAPRTYFSSIMVLDLEKTINFKYFNFSDNIGLSVKGHGVVDLKTKEHDFLYDASVAKINFYVPSFLEKINISHIKSTGRIAWKYSRWHFLAETRAQYISYEKSKIGPIRALVKLVDQDLTFNNISADFYRGHLGGEFKLMNWRHNREINGQVTMSSVDISALSATLGNIKLQGLVNAVLQFSGRMSAPLINFSVQADRLIIDRLAVDRTSFNGSYHDYLVEIPEWLSQVSSGSLEGKNLSYHSKTKVIGGSFYLSDLSLASSLYEYTKDADGSISGLISLGGSLVSPVILAPLQAKNLSLMGQKLGSGTFMVELKKDKLLASDQEEDIILSLSAVLKEYSGRSNIRFALALNRQTINAMVDFSDLNFNFHEILSNHIVAVQGLLSGNILAHGPLSLPDVQVHVIAHRYNFLDSSRLNAKAIIEKNYGPAILNLNIAKAYLNLDLCASFADKIGVDVCNTQNGLSLSLTGPFRFNAFSLDLSGAIYHDHFENIIPYFKNELATVGMVARIDSKISKVPDHALTATSKIYLDRFLASLPNIPKIQLQEPITIEMSQDQVYLRKDATFLFKQGQLAICGKIAKKGLNLKLGGSIPLVLSKFLMPVIQRGDGLAQGQLLITGSFESPLLEGYVEPEPGSSISFKKWFEPMEIRDGRITFIRSSPYSFTSRFDDILLGLGDGRLSIKGSFLQGYQSKMSKEQSIFDVQVEGSNIILRDHNDFMETDFKLDTVKKDQGPSVLSGRFTITDGSAYRQFDLRNFVAQLAGESLGFKYQALDGLNMNIDLEFLVRQFKASMRMINVDVDTILSGQLYAAGPINKPKFKGSLVVSEGTIKFPSTTFDLEESRIDLDELSDRIFDPKIIILSSQELEKAVYPQLSQDTTVELSFKGSLDRMSLELKPISGDLRLSPTRIFLLLLVPRGFGDDSRVDQIESLRKGAQNAAVAFSGEVFLRPLTNELQELLESQTKTRVQFGSALEPGRVTLRLNWKIGPRIELIGSYMFISEDARTLESDTSSFFYESYPLGDLKIKLLLLDHKPLGPLFLESVFGANQYSKGNLEPRGKIRLTYRVLSR